MWHSAFTVPTYVIKCDADRGIKPLAPELKTVGDLRRYKQLFATSASRGRAVLRNCPDVWICQKITEKQVNAYGLDNVIDLRPSVSAPAHFASLREAYQKGAPWLGYWWGPGAIPNSHFDLTILKELVHSPTCLQAGTGCGYSTSQVMLAVHPSLPIRAPGVYEFLRKWYFDTDTLIVALNYLELENRDFEKTAIVYLKYQEAVWTQWVPTKVAMRVKKALEYFH